MRGKVLIAEDEEALGEGIRHFLESKGYNVELKTNGKEALAGLERFDPDLLVTDIQMPEVSGIDLVKELRGKKKREDLPVLVLTAQPQLLEELKEYHVTILQKPERFEDIAREIDKFFCDSILESYSDQTP